ncbi:spermidine synthase [Candidatus Nanosalina sp. VS9-1]|uniref:spermidine synthase n=1 Tax=Candidatus Nanosalina sp. VS9-1 TaxID=3388566 RepID=UPI0039E1E190
MNLQNLSAQSFRPTRQQAAVIVSGIVSMGLEILAGRVLAPEFGNSIYTWGSIIGVSMLALSLGYHYGGKSSKNISFNDLSRYLTYTALYITALIYFGDMFLTLSSALPIPARYSAIIPVAVLFGPPTYFLGFISPYAVQLSKKEDKGEASGHFYAVGTAGSILGAFGTTFFLIPAFSVNSIYTFFAALSIIPAISSFRDPKSLLLPGIIIAGIVLGGSTPVSGNTVYEDSTPYQELRVSDSDGVRTLYLGGQPQSATYINGSDDYVWDYLDYFHMPFLMRDDVEKVLFIGGGGFTAPQRFAEMNISVDAVEIDPGVVKAAEQYFNLSESENLDVRTGDGRNFLEASEGDYDVIYVDAYRKAEVPFHLTTQEFMQLTYNKTDEDGVVVSNVISTASGPGSEFARSQYRTIDSVYESVYYFPTADTSLAQNIEIVASKNSRMSREGLGDRAKSYRGLNLSDEVGNLEDISPGDVPVLKDDYAPVEELMNPLIGEKYNIN